MQNAPRRLTPAFFLALLPAGSCVGPRETPLKSLPDLVDRGGLSEAGQAPRFVPPPGIRVETSFSLFEERRPDGGLDTAVLARIAIHNESHLPMRFAWEKSRLSFSFGPRLRPDAALTYDQETEAWHAAPPTLRPGETTDVLLRFPLPASQDPARLLGLCLHWGFALGRRTLKVASRARLP